MIQQVHNKPVDEETGLATFNRVPRGDGPKALRMNSNIARLDWIKNSFPETRPETPISTRPTPSAFVVEVVP